MTRKERLQFFLVWLALGVIPLFLRPLWQPDEGRYAEIPREMIASGNWLTPRLNEVLYFEKPPFQYWLSAISMKLFGESAFAARLPLALASFLTMYAAMRLARRLGSDRPVWASFAAVTCLLLYACGQVLTLDPLFSSLCVFTLAAAVEAVSLRYHEKSPDFMEQTEQTDRGAKSATCKSVTGWTLAFFTGAGCALMTKGPVVIVLVGGALLFSLYFAWNDARLRKAVLATLFSPYGWLAFAAITIPWFVMVNIANPGHAHFFFYTEHFERFTTTKHSRQGSDNPILDKLFFVPIVLAGVFPWLSACLAGARRAVKFIANSKGPRAPDAPLNKWTTAALLTAFAWPLLFFSISGSKLIPYMMPCIVPLIAIAIAFESEDGGYIPFKRVGIEMIALGAAFLLAALIVIFTPKTGVTPTRWVADLQLTNGGWWTLFLGLGFSLIGVWGVRGAGLTAPRWMAWHIAMLITLTIAAQQVSGPLRVIDHLVAQAPKEKTLWISHGDYFQILPFLTKGRVTVVNATGELNYGKERLSPAEQERWFSEGPLALTETGRRLRDEYPDRPVWALSDRRAWQKLPPESQAAWEVVDASPKACLLRFID
jgi:4-amino-4-deoxy-L-arabinose transferase-like glycosyltransferase